MDLTEAMQQRHSVRQYTPTPIGAEVLEALENEIAACNKESALHLQLVKDEPKAFDGFLAHYGKFGGVRNYIALIGKKSADLDEKCGYYGEHLVLKAQQLGLNTCWVAMTFRKVPSAFQIGSGEKLTAVIALGYGMTQGVAHKSKAPCDVSDAKEPAPDWFMAGVKAALLAPTAMNQQKFTLTYAGGKVNAKAGLGFYAKIDLGIVKYHFELGAGKDPSVWG